MIDRRMFLMGGMAIPLASSTAMAVTDGARRVDKSFAMNGNRVHIPWAKLPRQVRFFVAGDTHFAFHDERDDAYAGNYARMAKYSGQKDRFEQMLAKAKSEKVDAVILVGDNISFPTQANVEYLKAAMEESGVKWMYVAGNHDWHFEGDKGSDIEQRERWIDRRLKPLYQGENALMTSKVIGGVRFVMIDNSVYHVLPEQLKFYKEQVAKGEPICLFMHIPLYTDDMDSIFTCGNPEWGAAKDPYWEIERREKWADRQMESTFAFHDAVLATENLVGVFAGHQHELQVHRAEQMNQFTTPSNRLGAYLDVRIG